MEIDRARRRVKLRDLETLAAVVHSGGMRKAAETLHVAQPTVSKAIRQLEDALGLRLLERGRQGTEPTAFGTALARRTTALLDELLGALRELEWLSDPESGEVRLGCMETLHAGLVGATVGRMLDERPRMRIVLESGQSPELIGHFLSGRLVDFVVARPPSLPLPPDIDGEPLFHDVLKVAVGRESPHARRRRIGLADLVDECWILSRNEVTRAAPLVGAFEAAGVPFPRRVVLSGSLQMRASLLARGGYVTLVPHSLLPFGRYRQTFRTLPIDLPPWHTPTMVMTLRGRTLGPAATLFLDRLRAAARPLNLGELQMSGRRRVAARVR
ncbi:MAG TPA: LysR family transcriptional regulator [Burkholderiaceae bacterium]|nr:LysR family transcriptional regulator [Burkholderiaceae bacterium]